MTKRAGRYRAQLLVQSNHRGQLNNTLKRLCELGDNNKLGAKLRWSVDVDPLDMF